MEPNDWVAELELAASRLGTIDSAFAADPSRHERFVFDVAGVRADFSMQHIDEELMTLLVALASERGVPGRRDAMLAGEEANITESRKVLHTALRGTGPAPEVALAQGELERAFAIAGGLRSAGGPSVLVNIGIGGSHLGPAMACAAMRARADGPECKFVSNIDPADLDAALTGLDPAGTVFVVSSKTFTTQETMHNASRAREWVRASVGDAWTEHFVAVTADPDRAVAWGVRPERCLRFWDWVGGRFSVSSVIGLPLMVSIGPEAFREFLEGMAEMDAH
ncbi:MAG: hypothetical protein RL383_1172, partial [Actinomycetota bacterium]